MTAAPGAGPVTAAPGAGPVTAAPDPGARAAGAEIVDLLRRRSQATPFAGARLYLSRHGRCLLDVAVGEARPGTPMRADSVLHWSCAVKPLLAVVVMSLVEAGAVELTDPVHRHLPGFEVGGKSEVTIDHVLTHAGGFRHFDGPGPYLESYRGFLRRVLAADLEPGWRPGVDQGYHQETAWYVLAALVEAKLAVPYPQAVADVVCAPLGMDSTWVSMSPAVHRRVRHRIAVPTYVRHGAVRRVPFLASATACQTRCPSYGGYGTIQDLARFYEAALGALRGGGPFPLTPDTLRSMTGPVRGKAYDRTWDREYDYARGVFRGLSGHYGFGGRWSPSSFGLSGVVGHVVSGADPGTGVVIAASFGALATDWEDIAHLTDALYDLATAGDGGGPPG